MMSTHTEVSVKPWRFRLVVEVMVTVCAVLAIILAIMCLVLVKQLTTSLAELHYYQTMATTRQPNITRVPDRGDLVAFSVGSSVPFKSTTKARVPMEIDIYNPHGYYHHSDDCFHAPVKGVYSFSFGGLGDHQKIADLHLYTEMHGHGMVHVARAYGYTPSGWGGSGAASVIVQMERGEMASVWLYGSSNPALHGNVDPWGPTTLFTGKLERQLE